MLSDSEIIALSCIRAVGRKLAQIETNLITVNGDIYPLIGNPVVGMIDVHFAALRSSASDLRGLEKESVETVAGEKAAAAVKGCQDSFLGMSEAYGLACGPNRNADDVAILHRRFRKIASQALRHLTTYMDEVKGLPKPPIEDFIAAINRKAVAEKTARESDRLPISPRIHLPLDRPEAFRHTRATLGYAYGSLGGIDMAMKTEPKESLARIVLSHTCSVTIYLSTKASMLANSCRPEHSLFADHIQGASDDLAVLCHKVEKAIARKEASQKSTLDLKKCILPRIERIGDAIQRIEALRCENP